MDYLKNFKEKQLILFFLFPITLVSIKIVGNLILLLIFCFGVYKSITKKLNPYTHGDLKALSVLSLIYFLIMLGSIMLSSGFGPEIQHIARKLHFLFIPYIAVAFYKENFKFTDLIFSTKLALILSFFIVMTEVYFDEGFIFGASNNSGMINSNVFGDLIVTILFISIVNIFEEKGKDLLLTFIAILSSISVIFISGSRGSWLALIILFIVYMFFFFRRLQLAYSFNRKVVSIMILSVSIFTIFILPIVVDKYNSTIDNFENWNMDHSIYNSSGVRLDMWSSSLEALDKMPWYGYGYRLANKEVSKYSEFHSEIISKFTHLHNEYITTFMSAGFLGILSLLSILFLPLYLFFLRRETDGMNKYSMAGIFVCLSYIVFGNFHIAFGEEHVNALYVFLMAYFIPKVMKS